MLFRTALGQAIREIRLSQKKPLRAIAKQAPIALGYLSEIERGRKEVSSEILEGIANTLGVQLSELLAYTNDILILSEINSMSYASAH